MNTSTKSFRVSAALLAAGGLCWVVKFVVIAATDGATSGAADTATGVLYFSAVALMALGLAGLGASLLAGHHVVVRVLGAVTGVVTWVVTYLLLESIAQGVVGETDPAWLGEEVGIVLTGAVFLAVGLLLARPRAARRAERGPVAATRRSDLSVGG